MHRRYRQFVFQLYRRLRHPRILKQSPIRRWLARHFLDKTVWKPTRHTFAGGLAIGMFITMLIIPGQMPIAAALAAIFRFNIPIAVVACWLSNPVTMPPIIWWEIELGNWLSYALSLGTPPPLDWQDVKRMVGEIRSLGQFFDVIRPWAWSLYIGGVAAGTALAVASYTLIYLLWDAVLLLAHRRKKAVHESS